MLSNSGSEIVRFDETELLRINPKDSTLPIDTSAEWTKGFRLINQLIHELSTERFIDAIQGNDGSIHKFTKVNPLILPLLRERRLMIDQYWKISGAEAVQEVKTETAKGFARMLFQTNIDKKLKDKYREEAFKVIEADEYEKFKSVAK